MAEPAALKIDPRAVARHRRRLAQADAAPWLHQEVARRMAERLQIIRTPPTQWLDWGGWLGGGREAVQAVWPKVACSIVEPDAGLAGRSRAAVQGPWWTGRRSRLPVLTEDQLPEGQAQMLWANMGLHAEPDVPALLARWRRALAVDGFVMFSTYGPDTLAELRAIYAEAGWPAPHPPYVDMHDLGDELVHAGFADPVMDQEPLRLTWSGALPLVAELRSLGGHVGAHRFDGLRTPRWRERLLEALARRADAQGRISLSFEIVYGHAYKPQPRLPVGPETVIPLESLRESLGKRRKP